MIAGRDGRPQERLLAPLNFAGYILTVEGLKRKDALDNYLDTRTFGPYFSYSIDAGYVPIIGDYEVFKRIE